MAHKDEAEILTLPSGMYKWNQKVVQRRHAGMSILSKTRTTRGLCSTGKSPKSHFNLDHQENSIKRHMSLTMEFTACSLL